MIGGALSDKDAYAYLPQSMAYLPPPDGDGARCSREAGLPRRAPVQLSGGLTQLLVGTRA